MTKDASFKKAVRRHAAATGQRYTEALSDLEDLDRRMNHQPDGERLLAHPWGPLRHRPRRSFQAQCPQNLRLSHRPP
jgi:hypothetical protein